MLDEIELMPNEYTSLCKKELEAYIQGNLTQFTISLDLQGTAFQERVWLELCNISYGDTISYINLAKRLGDPKAVRAVGTANGKNPIAILVPCHRVIGQDGSLTGYAGGLDMKRWLLEHEARVSGRSLF